MIHFFSWLRSMLHKPQRYPIGYDALLLDGMRRARRTRCYLPLIRDKEKR